jgi:hypothetical protein
MSSFVIFTPRQTSVERYGMKSKFHSVAGHVGLHWEYRYNSTHPLKSGARWDGWSKPLPGRLTPMKETGYPLYRRLGGPQGVSGRVWKISLAPVSDPRT